MTKFRIGKICTLEKGKQIDTSLLSDNNKYKYINGGIAESGYYTDYNTSGAVVTVSEGGASCGFVNYLNEPFWCGCHCYKLTNIEFPPKYIYYALKANQEGIMALRTGSAMPNIKKSSFAQLEINLSEISAEQEQIVHNLEYIDNLIYERQAQCELYDQLVKSRFIEMFGRYPDNPMGWDTGIIKDAVSDVRYGSSRPAVEGGKYPYLRMNNITYGGELDLSDIKHIDVPENELDKCTVRCGDVLFNRTNSRELVGKTCVYNRDEMMVLAGFVIRVRVNERILPEFLSSFLNTDFSKQMLIGMCKAAIGQANINAQELQSIGLYFPPVNLQRQFIQFKAQTDKSKYYCSLSLEHCYLAKKYIQKRKMICQTLNF